MTFTLTTRTALRAAGLVAAAALPVILVAGPASAGDNWERTTGDNWERSANGDNWERLTGDNWERAGR